MCNSAEPLFPLEPRGPAKPRYQIHTEAIFPSTKGFGEGEIINQPWISKNPSVTQKQTSHALSTTNFIVGFALLVMLSPIGGKFPDKTAGVRTAIELIDKRAGKSMICSLQLLALS